MRLFTYGCNMTYLSPVTVLILNDWREWDGDTSSFAQRHTPGFPPTLWETPDDFLLSTY
jgi:hypothetical protein